mgnify:CR=1 FL=1|tara:strand:- start:1913 stop:2182 length:270 start_codon:yes stop_codon:yes gene_type:complete
MIIQLPNGRIIECSVEQYLSFTEQEIQNLNGLSSAYTKEVGDPFYNKFSNRPNSNPKSTRDTIEEYEPGLDEIDPYDKLDDPYFHSDDT